MIKAKQYLKFNGIVKLEGSAHLEDAYKKQCCVGKNL